MLFIDNIDLRAGVELELQNLYTRLEEIKIVWMEISIEKKHGTGTIPKEMDKH